MRNRTFFFGTLFGTALFVYLISSFLIATFNITLWENYHRFFAVVAYFFLVTTALDRTTTKKVSKVEEAEEAEEPDEQNVKILKQIEPEKAHAL
jgi:uncharacterized membrane protein